MRTPTLSTFRSCSLPFFPLHLHLPSPLSSGFGFLLRLSRFPSENAATMVDHQTVCCMCGDVGFPEKLFRCSKCRSRFQHSYCSNYYSESAEPIQVCEWCQCEGRNSMARHENSNPSSSKNNSKSVHANEVRPASDKIKQHHREEGGSSAEKATAKTPSPRTTPRRYKLLKDVMC